jgi:hypothetical protein
MSSSLIAGGAGAWRCRQSEWCNADVVDALQRVSEDCDSSELLATAASMDVHRSRPSMRTSPFRIPPASPYIDAQPFGALLSASSSPLRLLLQLSRRCSARLHTSSCGVLCDGVPRMQSVGTQVSTAGARCPFLTHSSTSARRPSDWLAHVRDKQCFLPLPLASEHPFSSEQECIDHIGAHAHHSSFAAGVPDQLRREGPLGHSASGIPHYSNTSRHR